MQPWRAGAASLELATFRQIGVRLPVELDWTCPVALVWSLKSACAVPISAAAGLDDTLLLWVLLFYRPKP